MSEEGETRPVVTWLPGHPAEGSYSMYTYWQELEAARQPGDPFEIECPLSPTLWKGRTAGRLNRALHRYLLYPLQVQLRTKPRIAHVLDHSSSHLLDRLPRGCKTVVTVHDLIPLVDGRGLTEAQVSRFGSVVERLRGADLLISVSEHTKGELARLLEIDASRVVVIPNGVSHLVDGERKWSGADRLREWREKHNGLVVGSVGSTLPRKNLQELGKAAPVWRAAGMKVVIARVGASLPAELRDQFGPEELIEFGRLDSDDLASFYKAIDAVVVPSTHEGFGLPVVEAMQHGKPVVCAEATSLPEVGGDAALYFELGDTEGLVAQFRHLASAEVRERLVDACRARAALFSWRKSLEAIYEAYRRLEASQPADGLIELPAACPMKGTIFRIS